MTHRAALFDLDGTLLNTLEDLADSMNKSLTDMGYPVHPLASHKLFVGGGFTVYAERALPPGANKDPVIIKECIERLHAEYGKRWNSKTHLYDGIAEMLDELVARGIIIAVFSNKPHSALVPIMEHYFKKWPFVAARGSDTSAPKKPDPTVALEIARGVGIEPREWIYLGDTDTDMQTARRSKMFAIGVLWGFRPREELVESGAEALIARPLEVLNLL